MSHKNMVTLDAAETATDFRFEFEATATGMSVITNVR
jgi:hypothetical protein